ncbi:MAG TPA: PAS domain S-box protein [Candidatus Hydrogenedentes bacterium]|nr:PAS domain S-box protein [Candidatus Hydrogenedentota bacterium]
MHDFPKTSADLIAELQTLRKRVAELESRQIEDQIRQCEERFRTLVEKSTDVIFVANEDSDSLHVTPSVTEMLGYTPEEFLALDISDLTHPEDLPRLQERVQEMRSTPGAAVSTVFRFQHKNGSWRVLDCTIRNLLNEPNVEVIVANFRDITERKRAEEALRESEEKYRRIVETATEGLVVTDASFLINFINAQAAQAIGYTVEEMLGKPINSFIFPEDIALLAGRMQLREQRGNERYELKLRAKDGSCVWALVSASPLTDDKGRFKGSFALFTNITDRKQTEEALRESEERLKLTLAAVKEGVWDWNLVTRELKFVSDYFTVLGYTADEFAQGYDFQRSLIHPEDVENLESTIAAAIARDEGFACEFRVRKKDGEWCWVLTRGKAVTWDDTGRPLRAVGTHSDITERKRVEAERDRLAMAIDQIAESVVIWDAKDTIQYVNPAFERTLGYARDEAIGQDINNLLNKEFFSETMKRDIDDTVDRGDVWKGQVVVQRKNGTSLTMETTISPIRDSHGNVISHVSVSRDITNELLLEEQLRQAQKMEAIGQLAGGVAHDFNNLLQVILVNLELIGDAHGPGTKVWEAAEDVRKAAQRAADLTSHLLAFSRRQSIQPVNLDLNDLVQGLLKMIWRVIGEHIELCFSPGVNLDTTFVDKGQMEQVLMNLCVNARDAMAHGGTLTIETKNITLDASFCRSQPWAVEGRYVLLCVTDAGCGIDAETLEHIFEPFFTTKEVGKGTGLGLAMVYGIVKQHHGLVCVESTPGTGTVFKIYLPAVDRPVQRPSGEVKMPVAGGAETILIAEDDPAVLKMVAMILKTAGYTALTAPNGTLALRLFEENADVIDLVILDVMMPGLSGRQVMDKILDKYPDTQFLFTSGYSEDAIHTDFVVQEGLQLVKKPYSRNDLLRAIRQILDIRAKIKN